MFSDLKNQFLNFIRRSVLPCPEYQAYFAISSSNLLHGILYHQWILRYKNLPFLNEETIFRVIIFAHKFQKGIFVCISLSQLKFSCILNEAACKIITHYLSRRRNDKETLDITKNTRQSRASKFIFSLFPRRVLVQTRYVTSMHVFISCKRSKISEIAQSIYGSI